MGLQLIDDDAIKGAWHTLCVALEAEPLAADKLLNAVLAFETQCLEHQDLNAEDYQADVVEQAISELVQARPVKLSADNFKEMNRLTLNFSRYYEFLPQDGRSDDAHHAKRFPLAVVILILSRIRRSQHPNVDYQAFELPETLQYDDTWPQYVTTRPMTRPELKRDITSFFPLIEVDARVGMLLNGSIRYHEDPALQVAWLALTDAICNIQSAPKIFIDALIIFENCVNDLHCRLDKQPDPNVYTMAMRQLQAFASPLPMDTKKLIALDKLCHDFSGALIKEPFAFMRTSDEQLACSRIMGLTARCRDVMAVYQHDLNFKDLTYPQIPDDAYDNTLPLHYAGQAMSQVESSFNLLEGEETIYLEETFVRWMEQQLYQLSLYVIENPKVDMSHYSQATAAKLIEKGLNLLGNDHSSELPIKRMAAFAQFALEQGAVDASLQSILNNGFTTLPGFNLMFQSTNSTDNNLKQIKAFQRSSFYQRAMEGRKYKGYGYFSFIARRHEKQVQAFETEHGTEAKLAAEKSRLETKSVAQRAALDKQIAAESAQIKTVGRAITGFKAGRRAIDTAKQESLSIQRQIRTLQQQIKSIEEKQTQLTALHDEQARLAQQANALSPEALQKRLNSIPVQATLRYLNDNMQSFSNSSQSWTTTIIQNIKMLYHTFERALLPNKHNKFIQSSLQTQGFFSDAQYIKRDERLEEDVARLTTASNPIRAAAS